MNSARDVYKNIVKSIKYAKENSKLLEMKKSNNMSEAIKEFEKNLNKKVEGDINTNEYKKMENCYRAIYILLGSEKEMSEIHISDIKDNELYNEFNKKMVGLCKSVSYGSFFEWLFQSWEHAYCITETDVKKRIKIINFYTELITIVFSVIKGMEEPEFVERAKEIYDCSMKIYINMKRVIVLLKHDVITDNKLENGLEQKENLKIQAIELLEEYCKIVDNVEEFNEENMYVKNHYDEYTQLKLIENFFKVNKNRIDKEVYDKYVEKSKEYTKTKDAIRKYKEMKRYEKYENLIKSDNPNLDGIIGDELDVLQRCRIEYRNNSQIDIQACIRKYEKDILEEKQRIFDDEKVFYW